MAYVTRSDLEKAVTPRKLVELLDDDNLARGLTTLAAAEVADSNITDKIDEAIADADAICDSYLRTRYDTPLATVPAALKKIATDLTIYNLYHRRRLEFGMPDDIETMQSKAMSWLRDLSSKKIELGIDEPAASERQSHIAASYGTAQFTSDVLDGSG